VTASRGTIDGAQAVADMVAEGFPQGSWVYLDLENGPPFPVAERGYAQAWAAAVDFGGYRAGVYCSFTFAAQVAAILPKARLWVFHVQSVSPHPVAGKAFPVPDPSKSGYPSAVIWQHQDEARLDDFGGLACDLDSSIYTDPGASYSAATPVAKPIAPAAAPSHTTVMVPVGSPVWIQQALNWVGASPALEVDGVIGPATYTAILAFQDKHGLAADGYVGPRTIAALQAAIQERA
jgi:hypothetical protein